MVDFTTSVFSLGRPSLTPFCSQLGFLWGSMLVPNWGAFCHHSGSMLLLLGKWSCLGPLLTPLCTSLVPILGWMLGSTFGHDHIQTHTQ